MKILGTVIVLTVCTVMGFRIDIYEKNKCRIIGEFVSALEILKSEIGFSGAVLERALKNIGEMTETEGIPEKTAKRIPEMGAEKAWEMSVEESEIDEESKRILIILAAKLGKTDNEGQIKHIEYVVSLLKKHEEKVKEKYEKNSRLYRSAGFLAGAAAVLFLV